MGAYVGVAVERREDKETVMETDFISPMQIWGDIGNINGFSGQKEKTQSNESLSLFGDVFRTAINQVKDTQADVETKQYLLSTGQLDDAHTLPIAEAKAGLAVDVLLTLRNKALEAYNELIKINV